jgi:hypothetical protein
MDLPNQIGADLGQRLTHRIRIRADAGQNAQVILVGMRDRDGFAGPAEHAKADVDGRAAMIE